MKAHVGVDSKTKMIHSVVATAANVADSTVLPELLHGEETKVWGDQAYRGQTEVMQEVAPGAQDMTHKQYRYKDRVDEIERSKNRTKSRVRSKVEHVFGVDEAEVRVCEGALSRIEKECQPAVLHLRIGQPLPGAQEAVVLSGVVSFKDARLPEQASRRAQRTNGNQGIDLNLPFQVIPA